ncbi:MAG: endolytic transglycosylase MltG, partial [Phycisphaerae bacterium]|nr:endolytic transglycosylase MltG [Phycisphaerae bacterium]
RQAAESLDAGGVIRSARAFSWYATLAGRDRRIKAGTYLIDRRSSWNAILGALEAGRGIVFSVTIPEGWDLKAIVPAIARTMSVPETALDTATRDTALIRRLGIPTASLEGYLFPETYLLPEGASAAAIVGRLVNEFERRWKPEWNAALARLGMTRHQIVTLASIIEKEARVDSERPLISAVYHNRLRRGMLLQADPTVLYALGRHASRVLYRDLEVRSPYNTYRNAGLPPGPIASPGTASLEAALFPAGVPYLYFVAHPDGHHEFRTTLREHNEAVRRMRALRSRR